MASDLHVDLDQARRKLEKVLSDHDPLPSDVMKPIEHALDDVEEARGKPRRRIRTPAILSHFDVGDVLGIIVQSYVGPQGQVTPCGMSQPEVRPAVVIQPPRHRSPQDLLTDVGGKPWFFTSELPVAIASIVDAWMHVELSSDRREMFHMSGEHWSSWHEKNGSFWSILTVFKDSAQITEVRHVNPRP